MEFVDVFMLLLSVPIVLLALSAHEAAHGYAAYKMGDPTAKAYGRLTLNPLKHLDPVGAICLLLFKFGWAKPVPINPRNFRDPRKGMALSALAGPACNFVAALLSALIALLFWKLTFFLYSVSAVSFWILFCNWVSIFFTLSFSLNLGLSLFNLIPIPPLDGSRILSLLLPAHLYFSYMKYERYIALGLMAFLLVDSYIGPHLISRFFGLVAAGISSLFSFIPFFQEVAAFLTAPVLFKL